MKLEQMTIGQPVKVYVPSGDVADTGADFDAGNTRYQEGHWIKTKIADLSDDPEDQFALVEDSWWEGSYLFNEIDPDDCFVQRGTIIYKPEE